MTPRGIPKPPGFAPKDDPRVGTKPPGTATAGCPHSRAVPCPLPPVLTWVATGDRPRLCGRDITRVPMSPPPPVCPPSPPAEEPAQPYTSPWRIPMGWVLGTRAPRCPPHTPRGVPSVLGVVAPLPVPASASIWSGNLTQNLETGGKEVRGPVPIG